MSSNNPSKSEENENLMVSSNPNSPTGMEPRKTSTLPPKALAVPGEGPPPITRTKELLILGMWLVANVGSVVACVGINKVLYSKHNFSFASSLMCFHFVLTYGFVRLAKVLSWYTPKRTEHEVVYVRLGAAMACAVGFANLSLLFNTMGMFQIFKFTNIFVVCAIEYVWKRKTYSFKIYVCLVVLTAAVLWASMGAVGLSMKGIIVGILGSLATAVYQITNKATQNDYDLKPLQLLEYEQPYCILWTAIFALCTDNIRGLVFFQYTPAVVALILSSGFFAFGVNVTSYMIIGKFGPVTYGVIGHLKALFVMLWGVILLQEIPSVKTGLGMVIAFGAVVTYTHLSLPPTPKPAVAAATAAIDKRVDLSVTGEEEEHIGEQKKV